MLVVEQVVVGRIVVVVMVGVVEVVIMVGKVVVVMVVVVQEGSLVDYCDLEGEDAINSRSSI